MRVNMSDVKAFILKQKNSTFDVKSFLCGSTSVWGGVEDNDNTDIATSAEYFTFTELDDGTYSIAAKDNADMSNMPTYVILPNYYNGKRVTQVADAGFYDTATNGSSPTVSIIVPEGYTKIGTYGFCGMRNLVTVKLPSTLKSLKGSPTSEGLAGCTFQNCTKLAEIELPNGLEVMGDYTFVECLALKAVFIPASVVTMGGMQFAGCSTVVYCEATEKPSGWVDLWCGSEGTVVWGYKPTDDSYFTFTEQADGTYSVVAKDSTNMPNEVIVPYSYNDKEVTALGYKAFNNCYNITKIVLPESIKTIGSTAFQNCEALTEVNIPSGVTEIGDYTFFNCKVLTTVTIPSGVTSIGELAFANCSAMTSIVIPASVTTIGMQAFFNSRNLTINCEATEQPEGWVNGWNSSGLTVNWGYTG